MPRARATHNASSLEQLRTGMHARVVAVRGGRRLQARLAAFGFVPGAGIQVLQNYGSGPIIVQVHGARVALGRGEAAHLFVEVNHPHGSSPGTHHGRASLL